jgi:hypothetical protein
MAVKAILNHRGFFSDYWIGTLLAQRQNRENRLTPAQARKALYRLSRLLERVDRPEPLDLTAFREQFARPLLGDLLGWRILPRAEDDSPRLRLLGALAEEEIAAAPLALLLLCPESDRMDAAVRDAEKALLAAGLDYAVLLSPECLRLVRVPGQGTRSASFDLSLVQAVAGQEVEALQAAALVFSAFAFQPGAGGKRPIDRLEEENRRHKSKVSEDLKPAVFQAAEMVVAGFLADLRARPEAIAPAPDIRELRDAGLLVLYRLLFVLYAESRDERLAAHVLYWKSYSLDMLVGRLLGQPFDELPANRTGLWSQLRALFNIYNDGLPALPGMQNIPPRGGRLFSHETPEGAIIQRLRLDDRTLGGLLLTLATTRPRRGVGRERISFRELEIEQLGSVYEGLLEFEPAIAAETLIHVAAQGREYALAPAELVRLCAEKELHLKGDSKLVDGTAAAHLHPDLQEEEEEEEGEEEEADTDGDENGEDPEAAEDKGLKKGAAVRLLRRLEPGDFFFRPGAARKASGSYYTTAEIVDYLVSEACAGIPADAAPEFLENLRVIDPACGSAHFLVGAARHLGAKLLAAYRRQSADPPPAFHPRRELTEAVRQEWEHLGLAWCKRRIVERCLFGVDYNPTAVQLAQVSLWIESLAGDRPLSFFEHHIRCGNSLMGTWEKRLQRPPIADWESKKKTASGGLFEYGVQDEIRRAFEARRLISEPMADTLRADTKDEYDYKAGRLAEAEQTLAHARLLFDLRSASAFIPKIWSIWPMLVAATDLETEARKCDWWPEFEAVRARERFFHWELEFPEVFSGERPGFDIVLGNPPWEKVIPDRKEFYGGFDVLIRAYAGGELDTRIRELNAANPGLDGKFDAYKDRINTISQVLKKGGDFPFVDWKIDGESVGGHSDLFKFFVERAHRILRDGGSLGFLVPSAIYNNEGCTGLRHLLLDHARIRRFYAFENRLKIFPIDSRYKFVLLVVVRREAEAGELEFPAAFMRHDPLELLSPPAEFQVMVRKSELEKLSPGTLAFLEYRTPRDREIVLKMYGLLPGQTPRPLLGDQGAEAWDAKFGQEFNMTTDRDLWTKPGGKLWTPQEVCGLDWPADGSISFAEVRAAMAEHGFWPLYEGKQIDQFLTDTKPVSRWLNIEAANQKYKQPPSAGAKLVFRDIASNTNERTCIAAVLPERSCSVNTLATLSVDPPLLGRALAVMNSLAFDYAVRLKTAGTHLNWTYISRVVVPTVEEMAGVPVLETVRGGEASLYDNPSYYPALWSLNRAVAVAFGLNADDMDHILNSFPGFARKRPAFYSYLLERIGEWKAGS